MEYIGVGSVTGLYGVSDIGNVILVDSSEAFENIKKGIERITSEKEGLTGFRSIAGRQADVDFILVQIPPYPQAVVEAVTELYMFGARRFIAIARGYRLVKKLPPRVALVARGAVGLDGVSSSIAGTGVPLVVSSRMEHFFKNVAEVRFQDFSWVYANTVTVPSPRLRYLGDMIRQYIGRRGIIAVDSIVAPLYALQYEFHNMESLAFLVLHDHADAAMTSTILPGVDSLEEAKSKIAREETILYMVAIEILRKLEGAK